MGALAPVAAPVPAQRMVSHGICSACLHTQLASLHPAAHAQPLGALRAA
jgi:hypothetical protein